MQQITFSNLVEQVQLLSVDEKLELQQLLEKYLLEERRNAIFAAYQEVLTIEKTLEFSSDLQTLKNRLKI